jgi:uncharacterized protein (TIGR03437 family)
MPGIFSVDASGKGQGAILNQDGSVNSSARAASKGSTVMIFGTGFGQTDPAGADGQITSGAAFPVTKSPVAVTIDGVPAQVSYSGAAPNLVAGTAQINAVVPGGVNSGNVQVVVYGGNVASTSGLTMAVR